MDFIMLRYVPSIPTMRRVFIMNKCWILANAFSASIEMIIWFLSFLLLIWCITLFVNTEPSFHPWNKSNLIMVYDPFYICWIWFANILLRIFASIFIKDIGLLFSFFSVFVWFWYQDSGDLIGWIWECSLRFSFWNGLRSLGISSSLYV